jgi:hypothetical protein
MWASNAVRAWLSRIITEIYEGMVPKQVYVIVGSEYLLSWTEGNLAKAQLRQTMAEPRTELSKPTWILYLHLLKLNYSSNFICIYSKLGHLVE